KIPASPAIAAHVDASIAAGNHMIGVAGVDPHRMIIAMDALYEILTKRSTAILGVKHLRAMNPDSLIVIGIDLDLAVIDRARIGVRHSGPRLSFIVAAKQSPRRVLDGRIDNIGVLALEA